MGGGTDRQTAGLYSCFTNDVVCFTGSSYLCLHAALKTYPFSRHFYSINNIRCGLLDGFLYQKFDMLFL
jgi:hypothetical protein